MTPTPGPTRRFYLTTLDLAAFLFVRAAVTILAALLLARVVAHTPPAPRPAAIDPAPPPPGVPGRVLWSF